MILSNNGFSLSVDATTNIVQTTQDATKASKVKFAQTPTDCPYGYHPTIMNGHPTCAKNNEPECPKGQYRPIAGRSPCTDVRTGYFIERVGDISKEIICPRGSSCQGGFKYPCTIGYYQNEIGKVQCKAVEDGFLALRGGLDAREPCPIGNICINNTPTPCPRGYSCSNIAMTPCPVGFYKDVAGQSSCTPLEAGNRIVFDSNSLRIGQIGCSKGQYTPSTPIVDDPCVFADDQYGPSQDLRTQVPCPAYTFSRKVAPTPSAVRPDYMKEFKERGVCTPCTRYSDPAVAKANNDYEGCFAPEMRCDRDTPSQCASRLCGGGGDWLYRIAELIGEYRCQ